MVLSVTHRQEQMAKDLRHLVCLFPAEVQRGDIHLLVSALLLEVSPFAIYLVPHFCGVFWCFLSVISLFKRVPKQSAKVLPSVPKCRKSVMCLVQKICMLDMHVRYACCLSMLMNQQYTLNKVFLNRNTHKTMLCIDQLVKIL